MEISVEQPPRKQSAVSEETMDEDEDLEKALQLSLDDKTQGEITQESASLGNQGFEEFLGRVFNFFMEMFSSSLLSSGTNVVPFSKLVLDLVKQSKNETLKIHRAKWFVREISSGISRFLGLPSQHQKLPRQEMMSLVTCLRALKNLLSPLNDSQRSHMPVGEPTNPICSVHGIPAVRRRCAKNGPNLNRRFYVCGKEKEQRCNYFEWADEAEKGRYKKSESEFHNIVTEQFWNSSSSSGVLHNRLCDLLEEEILGEESGYEVSLVATPGSREKKGEDYSLKSVYTRKDIEQEYEDGVFCSKEKLQDIDNAEALVKDELADTHELSRAMCSDRSALLLEAALDMVVLVADHKTDGISRWFSLLCELTMSTNKHSSVRSLATKVLKSLCCGNHNLYHSVRDNHSFQFFLRRLYHLSALQLASAIIVKEKARQCSADWRGKAVSWSNLKLGDLIGTNELVPEDAITEANVKKIGKTLDDLWTIVKNRGSSWRQFCGLPFLPHSHRDNTEGAGGDHREAEMHLAGTPPVVALFWIACSFVGNNQVKVLRLIDFALHKKHGNAVESEKQDGIPDGFVDSGVKASKPEEFLVELEVEETVKVALNMVRDGKTSELRRGGYHIISKLIELYPSHARLAVFERLIPAVENVGLLGKAGVEFLNLLQVLAHSLGVSNSFGTIADSFVDAFIQQHDALKYDRPNGEWLVLETGTGSSTSRKKFDLFPCSFCSKPQHPGPKEAGNKSVDRSDQAGSRKAGNKGEANTTSNLVSTRSASSRKKWHPDQISPYTRNRPDSDKTSNEFNLFYKLRCRLAISDFHINISDPRGRYVKVLHVYFTPRPVSDISMLKSDNYAEKWQKFVTLNLPKGATRASVSLSHPIVASNIKIEFSEFFERPGEGTRSADGSMLVHCPRCTRPVTNAHGVCGNCGEVAFQCRKCRHINYDRLDAFICKECGYCPMGSFSFELNAGAATNAIAITNDKDRDKAAKMLGLASSIQEELAETLAEKLRLLNRKKQDSHTDLGLFFEPGIQQAFLGLPPSEYEEGKEKHSSFPLDRLDKQGAVVKFIARPDASHGSGPRALSAADRSERTRSLIRLARQIRDESGSSGDRRVGRGISLDNLEEFLESANVLDSPPPRPQASGRSSEGADMNNNHHQEKRRKKGEECQKLLLMMREAGREKYELRRRLDAWECLNSGELVVSTSSFDVAVHDISFSPSHCSGCSATVAYHLLELWHKLFIVAPSQVSIDQRFLEILLQEEPTIQSKGLVESKKQAVVSIATKSEEGAKMVLKELRKRLVASQDMNCAEILGKVMEVEGFSMSKDYAQLAVEVLSTRMTNPE